MMKLLLNIQISIYYASMIKDLKRRQEEAFIASLPAFDAKYRVQYHDILNLDIEEVMF